jgi:hypothetical protein
MTAAVRSFLSAVQAAVRAEDGPRLATLLTMDKSHLPSGSSLPVALLSTNIEDAVNAYFARARGETKQWYDTLVAHCACIASLAKEDIITGYDHAYEALKAFSIIVQEAATNWVVRPLHVLAGETWRLCGRMTKAAEAAGQRETASAKIVSMYRGLACHYTIAT